jgi:hypothetical protein
LTGKTPRKVVYAKRDSATLALRLRGPFGAGPGVCRSVTLARVVED